jgi:hypothetical protein
MSTVYGENGLTGTGYTPPKRVNFGWLGEAFGLFRENAGLWIFATLIGVYAPIAFTMFVFIARGITAHVSHDAASLAQGIALVPIGLRLGVSILDLVFSAYVWGGILRMAVKQVSGEPISFNDVFSGSRNFVNTFIYLLIAQILVQVGSLFVLIPGIFFAAMLLPGFALVASGESFGSAMSKSFAAMKNDRFQAMALVFGLGAIIALSWLVFGLGPLVTLPMAALISALAYRDMIGLPSSGNLESIEAILGIKTDARPAVSLTGEPIDEPTSNSTTQK